MEAKCGQKGPRAKEDLPHESWPGSCEEWARQGQCVVNPGFMRLDAEIC